MLMAAGKLQFQARTLSLLVALVCWFTFTESFGQQQRPDLSGTWKLNLKASKLAPAHETDACQIKHAEPLIEVRCSFHGRNELYSYMTDGKERIANISADGTIRAKTYWDGETLVIEKRQDRGDTAWVSRYRLSQDAKVLELTQHITKSAVRSPFDESLYYDKQP